MMSSELTKIRKLSAKLGCGLSLTQDLLTLAGGDEQLVIQCSNATYGGVQSLKAAIIDERFAKLEARQ